MGRKKSKHEILRLVPHPVGLAQDKSADRLGGAGCRNLTIEV
ncbi:MAG: hypothetical protein ABSB78_12090 [Bacteroidota bacterium]